MEKSPLLSAFLLSTLLNSGCAYMNPEYRRLGTETRAHGMKVFTGTGHGVFRAEVHGDDPDEVQIEAANRLMGVLTPEMNDPTRRFEIMEITSKASKLRDKRRFIYKVRLKFVERLMQACSNHPDL